MQSTDRINGSIKSYTNEAINKLKPSCNTLSTQRDYTHWQTEEQANDDTASPIEEQQEEIVAGARFKVICFQTQRIIVQEIAIKQEMKTCRWIQWVVENTEKTKKVKFK